MLQGNFSSVSTRQEQPQIGLLLHLSVEVKGNALQAQEGQEGGVIDG
tara:strand:+ start:104 stop:244 length:141 start_codon:yes stop_codon:yes gene_type:complete